MSQDHPASPDHVPHITPMPVYLKTFATLLVLTVVTVGVSYINLGTSTNLAIAVTIATIKAGVVAAFFMHLATDHKFHTVIFLSSLVFLAIFVIFTSFDVQNRGLAERIERDRPKVSSDPWGTAAAAAAAAAATSTPAAPAAAPMKN